jgi:hypothetical protein
MRIWMQRWVDPAPPGPDSLNHLDALCPPLEFGDAHEATCAYAHDP